MSGYRLLALQKLIGERLREVYTVYSDICILKQHQDNTRRLEAAAAEGYAIELEDATAAAVAVEQTLQQPQYFCVAAHDIILVDAKMCGGASSLGHTIRIPFDSIERITALFPKVDRSLFVIH